MARDGVGKNRQNQRGCNSGCRNLHLDIVKDTTLTGDERNQVLTKFGRELRVGHRGIPEREHKQTRR